MLKTTKSLGSGLAGHYTSPESRVRNIIRVFIRNDGHRYANQVPRLASTPEEMFSSLTIDFGNILDREQPDEGVLGSPLVPCRRYNADDQ